MGDSKRRENGIGSIMEFKLSELQSMDYMPLLNTAPISKEKYADIERTVKALKEISKKYNINIITSKSKWRNL